MIELYILPPAFGLRNVSPYCLKAEMTLVYLGLDFTTVLQGDPRKAPKKKLPYAIFDGDVVADSELINERLDKMTNGGLYGGLSAAEIGQGRAFTRLCDDHLYWATVASRWLDPQWWPNIVAGFFSEIPFVIRGLVSNMARKQVVQTYDLQGMGRHTLAEQKQLVRDDLAAIDGVICEQGYITASKLTVFDINVASLLSGIYDNTPATWVTEVAREYPALIEYADKIQQQVGVFGREKP